MADKYLIVLRGQGDTAVTLAEAAAKQWIERPPKPGKTGWKEKIPTAVIANHNPDYKTAEVTIGSYDNDRALYCPGDSFDTVKAAFDFAKKNGHNIIDEYHGYIY